MILLHDFFSIEYKVLESSIGFFKKKSNLFFYDEGGSEDAEEKKGVELKDLLQ